MTIPTDYLERVYAGVLGKIIGVYLGRPFEGWTYERIMTELGEIWYYVHEQRGVPLIVTDDDISGTFTFIRALEDYDFSPSITPAQIGQTWLNYLIEGKTILSWAGLGCSTEHTAYLRLKYGIPAPRSGSIEMNGPIVAQQIGSQIFIDSWAMVAPGNPFLAADLARRAASVSHDGEAIFGAQLLAAMEAQAFFERDRDKLLDCGLSQIPADSHMARMVADLREFHAKEPDWRKGREFITHMYGYNTYPGGCHIVPNSALIVLGLLYGEDDFQKSLMITNTSGWDTDCNSGNLGCLLGIKNGLAGIDNSPVDWRGPIADRLFLPTADGGRAISDAANEAIAIANTGLRLAGHESLAPKANMDSQGSGTSRFHFELPGSVQGFQTAQEAGCSVVEVFNTAGHSREGKRSLCLRTAGAGRIATATFIPPEALHMPGYGLLASPTLYPGQTVHACLEADAGNEQPASVGLFVRAYAADGSPLHINGPVIELEPGGYESLSWVIPETSGAPIYEIGLQLGSAGTYYLDGLTWSGAPNFAFGSLPGSAAQVWRQAWVNGVQHWEGWSDEPYRIVQNEGRGMLICGAREWQDYRLEAEVRPAFLSRKGGIAVRVQGMRRFYGLLLKREGTLCLIKERDGEIVLSETPFPYQPWQVVALKLQAENALRGDQNTVRLRAWVNGDLIFDQIDSEKPIDCGGIGLVIEEGHLLADHIAVRPAAD